jgi:hypothetical protein
MPSLTRSFDDMQDLGPIVEIKIAIPRLAEDLMRVVGNQPPNPLSITAMIDTGSTFTIIQGGLASQLGLEPIGVEYLSTPSSQDVASYRYQVRVIFSNNVITEVTAVEAPLAGQHIQCLIGRDILAQGVLIYNGLINQYTLSF